MSLSPTEQRLYDFARFSVPQWFWALPRSEEDLRSMVKIFDGALQETDLAVARTLILEATGIWLDQHGADRNVKRQSGESDAVYAARIRRVEDEVTRPALLDAVTAILVAAGISDPPHMIELRRDKAYFGTFVDRTGEGGTFATVSGNVRTFTPTVPFELPIEVDYERSGAQGNPRVIFSGSTSGGNNGTFEITALVGGAIEYTNATAVAGADSATDYSIRLYDIDGNPRSSSTGRRRAYFGRGYRMSHRGLFFIVILPYGTSAAVGDAVADMLRYKKAAGVRYAVEIRANP